MEPIKRISLTDEVVNSMKDLILSGEYTAGQKIPPDTLLCKQLGVSRPTLREAIKVLNAMGYIDIVVGKGSFVADFSKKQSFDDSKRLLHIQNFKNFMQVRLALEPAALKLAVPKMTDAHIRALEKIHSAFAESIQRKDTAKLLLLDEAFHAAIFEYSGNRLMAEINKTLNENVRQFRADSFSDDAIYQNSLHPHEKILYYIKQRDVAKSVQALRSHLLQVDKDIQKMLARS